MSLSNATQGDGLQIQWQSSRYLRIRVRPNLPVSRPGWVTRRAGLEVQESAVAVPGLAPSAKRITTVHDFLRYLSRRQSTFAVRYGLPVIVIGLLSLLRQFVPLDTAPFLLYMPVIFVVGVALGRGPALVGMVLSTGFAAWFFWRAPPYGQLSVGHIVALVQYVIVGCGMVLVCEALRKVVTANEEALLAMASLNAALTQREATLASAKDDAEAARNEALAAKEEAERAKDAAVRAKTEAETAKDEALAAKAEAEGAKDAAEAANQAKSSFLANMSHELRTPLSAVIGYSEMMEEEVEDLGETGLLTDLGKIKSNARHLLSLINDVLDLSKVEANRMDTYAEDVEVRTLGRSGGRHRGRSRGAEGQQARGGDRTRRRARCTPTW